MFGHYATYHTLMRLVYWKMTKFGMEFCYFEHGKCREKVGISPVQIWRNPDTVYSNSTAMQPLQVGRVDQNKLGQDGI